MKGKSFLITGITCLLAVLKVAAQPSMPEVDSAVICQGEVTPALAAYGSDIRGYATNDTGTVMTDPRDGTMRNPNAGNTEDCTAGMK